MKIAISGAGVAGPALAHWLHRTGHEPTLIERAPHFRTGGYVIDFWGVGYQVAQLMGIEAAIRDAGYQVQSIRSVGPDGQVGPAWASRRSGAQRAAIHQPAARRPGRRHLRHDRTTSKHLRRLHYRDQRTPRWRVCELRAGQDP